MPEFKAYKNGNFYVDKRYEIRQVLGKGSYGVVCLAVDTKANSGTVWLAVKKIGGILYKQVLLRRAIRELKMMRHFRGHRNVCISIFTISIFQCSLTDPRLSL